MKIKNNKFHLLKLTDWVGMILIVPAKPVLKLWFSPFQNLFLISEKFNEHQKTIASARAGNVIGGGDWNTDRIIPDIVKHLLKGNKIPVRNPDAIRPWQHVLEPLGGYLLAAGILNENEKLIQGL